jgi:hypothetical protein
MRLLYFITIVLFLSSCHNKGYEQFYADYADFEKVKNKRLTGWFPEIITHDSYEIQNTSYLDICAFSSIKYNNNSTADSLLHLYKPISTTEFKKVLEKHQSKVPVWFVSLDSVEDEAYEVVELNKKLYALKKKTENRIYTLSFY